MSLLKHWNKLVLASLLLGLTGLPLAALAQNGTSSKQEPGKVYSLVEQMPQFEGGKQDMLKFISSSIKYPREAINHGTQGTTYVSFVIEPDGSLSQAEALQKLGHGIEEEALRVINQMQGRWTPGKQDGKAVAVRYTLPIKFTLMNDDMQGINQPLTDSLNNVRPLSDARAKRRMDQYPRFKGDRPELQRFIGEHLRYPVSAKEGTVTVSFILDEKGNVSHAKVKQSISPEMDAEAVRVVSLTSGQWEPAMHEGKLMKVGYLLPIRIKQEGGLAAPAPGTDNTLYVAADQMPEYIAGHEGFYTTLSEKLVLPADLRKKDIFARLEVQFIVEKNGSLSDIRVTDTKFIKTVGPGTEFNYMDASRLGLVNKAQQAQLVEATVSAIKSTSGQWTPGIRNGREVRVEHKLPVSFRGSAKAMAGQPAMKTVTILNPGGVSRPAAPKTAKEKKFTHQVVYSVPQNRPVTSDADRGDFVNPTFAGGPTQGFFKFLREQVRYPENTKAEGEVKASFRLLEDGKLSTITVPPGTDPDLEKEVVRVINLMDGMWTSGSYKGKAMPATINIVFSFELKERLSERKPPNGGVIVVEKLR